MARKFMDRLKRSKAFNLFLALMLTVSTLPVQAFAAESADVQSRMSGTCYVQCVRSAWDGGTLFNLTMPDGQVIQGYCLNPGWPTPVDGNYPFTAVDRGDGTYIVTVATSYITSDINQIHPFDHGHMVGRPPWRTQTVGNAIWAVLRYGKISLHKQSANPGCTDGNALYSLAGAEYGIYSDPGCTQWVATMVTDAAGNATSGDLKTGTYYVKEGKASEGFQVDPTVYTVNVAANATVAVNNGVVYETPINDPAGVIIAKYDGDKSYNANNLPQGSASLEGAEFTVRYYDGFYDTEQQAEASGAPTRTWVFKTNKNLRLDEHALARSGLAGDEAHGRRQLLAVAEYEVAAVLVLAAVVATLIREFLRCEGHEHGDLGGRRVPGHVDVVVSERQDGVEGLGLAVVQHVEFDGVAARRADDAQHLVVELLPAGCVGVDEAGEEVEVLPLAREVIEHALGLLLAVFQLEGEDGEVVALAHGGALLLDDLLVDPCGPLADEGGCLGLLDGLREPRHGHGDREVHDVRQRVVGQLRSEAAEHEHLPPHVVEAEAVAAALRLEVDGGGGDEVLGGLRHAQAEVALVVHVEGLAGVEQAVQDREAFLAVQGAALRPDAAQQARGRRLKARELRHRGVRALCGAGDRQKAATSDVRHALPRLLGEDRVEGPGVLGCLRRDLALGVEEAARGELLPQDRRVDDGHLDDRAGAELVVELSHGLIGVELHVVSDAVVARIGELDGLRVEPFVHLADPVLVHAVVADIRGDVLGRAVPRRGSRPER